MVAVIPSVAVSLSPYLGEANYTNNGCQSHAPQRRLGESAESTRFTADKEEDDSETTKQSR